MKKVLIGILMMLVPVSMASAEPFIAAEGASIVSSGPKITVIEPTYYFGVVGANRQLRHTFVFRNDGVEDLIIHKVSPP